MHLFEKIFNYQVISRLEESGAIALTSQERGWLKLMLEHPAAADAFDPGTIEKLRTLLQPEPVVEIRDVIMEKSRSRERQVYHPLLRMLRGIILRNEGIRMTFSIKNGRVNDEVRGFPYKLEYSMVKREWYLLWYNTSHRTFMSTKLQNIISVSERTLPPGIAESMRDKVAGILESRKQQAVVEVVRSYNPELSRILYAFSCFEKEVAYDDSSDTYRIKLAFLADESEYVLSKIRFLGTRVRIVDGGSLKRRMAESAAKALARYRESF
ncbi:WYL domain-containing protein [Paenibacillus sp. sptzw28]|uniref:WYL domain-containing protein n=1 Tax=Paenibacillus sp. sptzw28 TaxID=715179 RepID=UPI001C6DF9C4|nr:WYL domain-containing protein [Paenibacillus sp. sptzw28]QYR21000.1 WYL domain-containing protein [Paenibacillus sp. sptzw28]